MATRLLPRTVVHLVIGIFEVDLMSSKLVNTGCMSYAPGEAGLVTGGAALPCITGFTLGPLPYLHISRHLHLLSHDLALCRPLNILEP